MANAHKIGIPEVCARAGLDVLVCKTTQDHIGAAQAPISGSLDCALRKGRPANEGHDRAIARLTDVDGIREKPDRDPVTEATADSMGRRFKERYLVVPTLVSRMVRARQLGLSAGRRGREQRFWRHHK